MVTHAELIFLDDVNILSGPENRAVEFGRHSSDFEDRIGKTHYVGRRLGAEEVWQAKGMNYESLFWAVSICLHKEHILKEIVDRAREAIQPYRAPEAGLPHPSWILQLPDDIYTGSNLFAYQKSFDGPFQFDVFYESASAKQKLSCTSGESISGVHAEKNSAALLDQGIPSLVEAYGKRFNEVFPYPKDFSSQDKQKLEDFSKAITSNLLGGVGYFYGNSVVNKKFSYEWDEDDDTTAEDNNEGKGARLTAPKALLTATPSRSFFPRGFYWYVLAFDHHSRW